MFKKLFITSLYILLFLCVGLQAQEPLQGIKHGVKEFAVADVSCESSRTCNSFLKVISHSSGFPIDEARYSIYYTFQYNSKDSDIEITVSLDSIRGTTEYRGFDLSGKLLPSSIELAWAFQEVSGSRIPGGHKEVFRNGSNTYHITSSMPENIETASVVPVDIQFIYREEDFEDFDAASRMIQRYYATSEICDTILRRVGNIDTKDFTNLVSGYLYYYDFRRVEKRLREEHFSAHLPLDILDPADHTGDMRRVAGRLYGLKMNLDNSLSAWSGLVRQKNAQDLAYDIYSQSQFWYELSNDVEYHYKDLVYCLAETKEDFCIADSLARTFRKDNPGFYNLLCEITADQFLEAAKYNLDNENYTHAIALGDNAKFYTLKCDIPNQDVDKLLSDAWGGLYESYLLISRRTITIGNYEFAEQYLNEASEIYNRSNGALTSNEKVNEIFLHLYESIYNQGMTSLEYNVPRDALFFLNEAARIDSLYLEASHSTQVKTQLDKLQHAVYYSYLDEIAYFVGSENGFMARNYYDRATKYKDENGILDEGLLLDSLDSRIQQLEYLDFMKSAEEAWPEDPATSVSWLEQAAYYVSHHNITPGPEWHNAIENMLIPDMENRLSHGRVLVWGGKIDEALQLIEEMNGVVNRFSLNGHSINVLVQDLSERIDKKRCFDLENNYRKNIFAVKSSIRENNFLEASKTLDELHIDDAEGCGVDVSEARVIDSEYGLFFQYYRYIDTCRTHLIYSRAEEAVKYYLMAVESAKNIRDVTGLFDEIKLPPLMEMYRREAMAGEVAGALTNMNPFLAVEVLQFGVVKNVKIDRKILHCTGIALGEIDLETDEIRDGSQYSEGRKALKPLEKAYNAQVKSPTSIMARIALKFYTRKD